ncbi:unnamed protein product [Ranitomeya imitator]|uniref:Clr5 domain-containing protein n=1 Tax=Ranitomeya imitator TaxID=111125 RepID=A0ABN9KSX7_9NEOB|nr:unnamed protein product [Ranitomeya imitator]
MAAACLRDRSRLLHQLPDVYPGYRHRWSLESGLCDSSPATKQRRCSDPDRCRYRCSVAKCEGAFSIAQRQKAANWWWGRSYTELMNIEDYMAADEWLRRIYGGHQLFTRDQLICRLGRQFKLRHPNNKLDVGPTSSAAYDPIMEAKRAGSSATRKISRKDGRYHEDSNAYHSKHSHPAKSGKERSSRSPLRVTTLDSNVKSSCRVGFREPLASYRSLIQQCSDTIRHQNVVFGGVQEGKEMEVLSSEEKGSGTGPKNFRQDEKDFDSTRSSCCGRDHCALSK